jgi:hypothetical protein
MAYFIFLIKTRLHKEHRKIWITSFGSTNLETWIFEPSTQIYEKNKNQNKILTLLGY